jgi:hypothetical protein
MAMHFIDPFDGMATLCRRYWSSFVDITDDAKLVTCEFCVSILKEINGDDD